MSLQNQLQGFHHVKLPVSDVRESAGWYERVLGLAVAIEFVEDGVLRGVAMRDPGHTLLIALREEPHRAAALGGFDPLAIAVPTLEALRAWTARLDALGVPHTGIAEGSVGWLVGGLIDPDGVEIRLYTLEGRT
nr:VOC family protein [Herbidospora cretacea]